MERETLLSWIDQVLKVDEFEDYAPNGLQVEGAPNVTGVLTAVTASLAAIERAAEIGANMLIVHHGMFWKNEPKTIVGWKKDRVRRLLLNDVNMAAYHLPLDAHPLWGNNAKIGQKMGWREDRRAQKGLLCLGYASQEQTLSEVARKVGEVFGGRPIAVGDGNDVVKKVAWCSGAAQGFFQDAIDWGADLYLTGEASEAQYHLAQETGCAFLAAGHHRTERFGAMELGAQIAVQFDLPVEFFDEPNPF